MTAPSAPDLAAGTTAISVVVPVYRQWGLARQLLAALAAQSLPAADFEVLLVDNDPDAGPPPLPPPPNGRILPCAAKGSYAARNVGVAAARGELIVFTDADCRPHPDWLAAFAEAAEAPGAEATILAGPVRFEASALPNRYEAYEMLRGIPQERYVRLGYAATANLAVPAAVFARVGGFDATRFSGGDAEFCRRATGRGYRVRLVPEAVVTHPARADWAALATKARRVKGGQIASGSAASRRCGSCAP